MKKMLTKLDRLLGRIEANWSVSGERERAVKYLVIYTLVYISLVAVVMSPFIRHGISILRITDGTQQHFPIEVYMGEYARRIVRN